MDRDTAIELANQWHDLQNRPGDARSAHNRLSRTLRDLLPVDITTAGIAFVEDVPTVLALYSTSVFAVSVDTERAENPAVGVRCLPLAPGRISVTLTDDRAGKAPSSGDAAHVREWTFRWDSGETLRLTSVLKVYNGWGDVSQSAEDFARALTRALAWNMPDDEQ